MQNVGKLMMHHLEVIFIHAVDIRQIQPVPHIQSHFQSAFGSSQCIRPLIPRSRTYKMNNFRSTSTCKIKTSHFIIGLQPAMFHYLRQFHTQPKVRRYKIVRIIGFNMFHSVFKVDVIGIDVVFE